MHLGAPLVPPLPFWVALQVGTVDDCSGVEDFSVQQNFAPYVYTGDAPVSVFFFCSVERNAETE